MYKALYRKWRPKNFDDVCGQDGITDILKYEVANNKISHAYLFCGSRGTGKTSCAKILAKAINCENSKDGNPCNKCEACLSIEAGIATDVIEMDAASNTGVDNVRDIKEEIVFTPALLKYRVYIIDEVHMMSGGAFNALLKTLEEPPSHAVFILATTELHKLPSTIVSRCQHFDFRRLMTDIIVKRLMYVAGEEGISLLESGARLIAKTAQGGMRDALSLLELCGGMKEDIDEALVIRILGVGNRESVAKLVKAISAKDYCSIYSIISDVVLSSKDLSVFWKEVIDYYRDLIVLKLMAPENAREYLDLTDSEVEALIDISSDFSTEQLLYHSKLLEEAFSNMQRLGQSKQSIAELALTRMCEPKLSSSMESMLLRISELEKVQSMVKISGEARERSVETAPVKKEAKPAKEEKINLTSSPEKQVGELKACAAWSEIIEEISKTKKNVAGPLGDTKCFVHGTDYIIKVKNNFIAELISRDDVIKAIKCAIVSIENIDNCNVIVEEESENAAGFVLIEELEKSI